MDNVVTLKLNYNFIYHYAIHLKTVK